MGLPNEIPILNPESMKKMRVDEILRKVKDIDENGLSMENIRFMQALKVVGSRLKDPETEISEDILKKFDDIVKYFSNFSDPNFMNKWDNIPNMKKEEILQDLERVVAPQANETLNRLTEINQKLEELGIERPDPFEVMQGKVIDTMGLGR